MALALNLILMLFNLVGIFIVGDLKYLVWSIVNGIASLICFVIFKDLTEEKKDRVQ